jgi:hypothetical protein
VCLFGHVSHNMSAKNEGNAHNINEFLEFCEDKMHMNTRKMSDRAVKKYQN